MLDFPRMLWVKLPLADRIHPLKATSLQRVCRTGLMHYADSKLKESLDCDIPFLARVYDDCMSQAEHPDIGWCEEPGLLLKLASLSLCSTHNLKEFISELLVIGSKSFYPTISVAAAFPCERGRGNVELRLISLTNQIVFV